MTGKLFNTALFALVTAATIVAAAIELRAEWAACAAIAQTAQPVDVAVREVITFPTVTVIGHRALQAASATQSADAQVDSVSVAVSDY
jgi:hypothetical protein